MKTNKVKMILALKALGTDINFICCHEEEGSFKDQLIDVLGCKLKKLASRDITNALLGESNNNIDSICEILVNHNMDVAYKLFDNYRTCKSNEEARDYFRLLQYLFIDSRKSNNFIFYCYIKDVELHPDIDLYNSNAVFNFLYSNYYIVSLYEKEYMIGQLLTPEETELFNMMNAAILKVYQHPEILEVEWKE